MFWHNFKYTLKIIVKNKPVIFWAVVWPLILGTLFNLAFSNLSNAEKLTTINLGIVDNTDYNNQEYLKTTMSNLSDNTNADYLFNTNYDNIDNLNEQLDKETIDGYIYVNNDEIKVIVKNSSINQTIIKYVVDEVIEYQSLTTSLVKSEIQNKIDIGEIPNTNQIISDVSNKLSTNKIYTNNISSKNMNYIVIEFYTLIAMACLYGSMLSREAIQNYLANSSHKGSRITIAPVKRITLILSGFLAAFIIQIISIGILLLYSKYCLNVDFGSNYSQIILLATVGSLAGLSLGTVIGAYPFKSNTTRTAITNVIVMLGCFFSGMMGVTMKYIIDKNMPIINKINPANMITDGFYSLYYYNDLNRYFNDLIGLIIFSITLLVVAIIFLRRKRYDSI